MFYRYHAFHYLFSLFIKFSLFIRFIYFLNLLFLSSTNVEVMFYISIIFMAFPKILAMSKVNISILFLNNRRFSYYFNFCHQLSFPSYCFLAFLSLLILNTHPILSSFIFKISCLGRRAAQLLRAGALGNGTATLISTWARDLSPSQLE